jgi:CO/xanthine dehydrogenase Mo-binding subunit
MSGNLGIDFPREDGLDKVHGRARYTDDMSIPGMLHTVILSSPHAHARIRGIETAEAARCPGVRGVFTGRDFPYRIGIYLGDKPPLAIGKVRYHGEFVAAVVADSEELALQSLSRVRASYEPLPAVGTPEEALSSDAPLIHEEMGEYSRIPAILPEQGTNVANRTRIRKGSVEQGFRDAAVVVEEEFMLPPGDHAAMEPRVAIAEIGADGRATIHSSTQSPYVVRNLLSLHFGVPHRDITVVAPFVGGGFGGKAGIQLEALAYLLSRAMGGRPVRVANTRESDLIGSPGRPGLQAWVRLGARRDGGIVAADIRLLFDSGAYADYAVNVSRAAGYMATGPYRVPNVRVDSLCVYTNHPFATAYRGFGHIELAYVIERAVDILADRLGVDPVKLRLLNAIRTGDTAPSMQVMDSNTGDLRGCIDRVSERLEWNRGQRIRVSDNVVRAKGVASFWKAPAIPTNTDAGTVLSFNEDGSVNLVTGVVEIGTATHSGIAQIVAERLGMDPEMVHVVREVATDRAAHDWSTAASRSLFMAGRAALAAVDDAVGQIRALAAMVLHCPEEDLDVHRGRVFLRDEPVRGLPLTEVVLGYTYPNGNAIGGPIIGRGRYIARGLTGIDPETGEGNPALEFTLGAHGIEVEVDLRDGSFKIVRAVCCMDVGRVINPQLARGQIVGGMAMAIGFTTQEGFLFDSRERVQNRVLRDFKLPRYGEHPEYLVDFLETPQGDGPYGARGLGEQGVLGIPGALANALSRALGKKLNRLPLTPEYLWRVYRGEVL